MKKTDGRKLGEEKLAELRNKVAKIYREKGGNAAKTARYLGVSRYFVIKWINRYGEQWNKALKEGRSIKYIYLTSEKRGRRANKLHYASEEIREEAKRLIDNNAPHEIGINSLLWTERAVKKLFKCKYDISLNHDTVYYFIRHLVFNDKREYRKDKETFIRVHYDGYGYVIINGYIYFLRKPKYTTIYDWEMVIRKLVIKQRKKQIL